MDDILPTKRLLRKPEDRNENVFYVGVDTGGTFTDTVVATGDGRVAVGKALSSREDPAEAVLRSVAAAGQQLGLTAEEILAGAHVFSHGTTIGLNALLTDRGARVGLLST